MNRSVNEDSVGPLVAEAVGGLLTAMGGTVVKGPPVPICVTPESCQPFNSARVNRVPVVTFGVLTT